MTKFSQKLLEIIPKKQDSIDKNLQHPLCLYSVESKFECCLAEQQDACVVLVLKRCWSLSKFKINCKVYLFVFVNHSLLGGLVIRVDFYFGELFFF